MSFWIVDAEGRLKCDEIDYTHSTAAEIAALEVDCRYEQGTSLLYQAAQIWRLLGSPRGEELYRLLRDEFELRDEEGRRVIDASQIARAHALIADLRQEARRITTEGWRLTPEAAQLFLAQASDLVTTWNENGQPVHSIANVISAIDGAAAFLTYALREGYNIALD